MTSSITEYKIKMKKIHEHLGGVCVQCGSIDNLHIDHIDHLKKLFTVSKCWGYSWEILLDELSKCQLLCKTCHLDKSKNEGSLAKGWANKPRQKHGTVWSYNKYKCRCELCRQAKSVAMKKQYKTGCS